MADRGRGGIVRTGVADGLDGRRGSQTAEVSQELGANVDGRRGVGEGSATVVWIGGGGGVGPAGGGRQTTGARARRLRYAKQEKESERMTKWQKNKFFFC